MALSSWLLFPVYRGLITEAQPTQGGGQGKGGEERRTGPGAPSNSRNKIGLLQTPARAAVPLLTAIAPKNATYAKESAEEGQ
jgi:hypothetical protein